MKAKSKKGVHSSTSPIAVTQAEVDEMATGGSGTRVVIRRIRVSVPSGPLGKKTSLKRSPVLITRKEMETIRKKGEPSKKVLAKIAKSNLKKSRSVKGHVSSTASKRIPVRNPQKG